MSGGGGGMYCSEAWLFWVCIIEKIVHQSNNQVYNCVFGGGCPEWEKLSVISLSVFF